MNSASKWFHFTANTSTRLSLTMLVAVLGLSPLPGQAAPEGYKMVWADEFTGEKLDTAKWTAEAYRRRAAQNCVEAVTVKDGILSLTTFTEGGTNYTGFLSSKGKYATAFGYFEARIRFHTTPGEWGAFWVHTPTMGKPLGDVAKAGTEIDIVEHRAKDDKGKDISNTYVMNLHWDGYDKSTHKHAGSKSTVPAGAAPLQDNWHVYALPWTPERYAFYLDGVEQWTSTNAISHRPEHMLLTCEVQEKGWAGAIPEGGFGSRTESKTKMDVDWVRVWQEP